MRCGAVRLPGYGDNMLKALNASIPNQGRVPQADGQDQTIRRHWCSVSRTGWSAAEEGLTQVMADDQEALAPAGAPATARFGSSASGALLTPAAVA